MISKSELPENYHSAKVIRSSERTRCQRMTSALERTLKRCNEMYAEYESHTVSLRKNSQKEGFTQGFELFFSQLFTFLEEYDKRQNRRLEDLRESIINSVKSSFHDTVIVQRILHHLHEQCGQQKPLRIIIPKQVNLPDGIDLSNYIFSDDSHITLQNDMDSIRFPSSAICQKWLDTADSSIIPRTENINELLPNLLNDINKKINYLIENYY